MIIRVRRASAIVALSPLTWAATASAECAWVGLATCLPDTVDPRGPKGK
jgi:hypothetical protein